MTRFPMTAANAGIHTLPGPGRRAALGFVFLWFFVGGIAHFAFTDLEMRIVPPGWRGRARRSG